MIPDELHLGGSICKLELGEQQRALILKVQLIYTHNESDAQIFADLGPLFEVSDVPEHAESAHPDKTGVVRFMVPGRRWNGVVDPGARDLYAPNLVNLGINILQQAGFENSILEARSTVVCDVGIIINPAFQAFHSTDPLFAFLLLHKQHFVELHSDDIRMQNETVYLVRTSLVEQVKAFFRDIVFPHLRYTQAKALPLRCHFTSDAPNTMMLMFTTDYLVISPSVPAFKSTDIKLNI